MRFVSYNVNSLNARLPRVLALLAEHQPDIVCLQETKAKPEAFPHDALGAAGYGAIDHSGGRWEGVAVLAKREMDPVLISRGLAGEPQPAQARWVEADVAGTRVISVYVPNGQAIGSPPFLEKLEFLELMVERAAHLADQPTIIAGDMNVCPTDLDVWDVVKIHGGTHITPQERGRYLALSELGYVDVFRLANPDDPGFTWWDYRAGHFHKGFGLRIDHALVSPAFHAPVERVWVDRSFRKPTRVPESKPSDHAPLIADFGEL